MSAKTSAALSALLACMIFGSGCGKNANEPVRNDDSSSAENEAYKVSDNNSASDDISEKKMIQISGSRFSARYSKASMKSLMMLPR